MIKPAGREEIAYELFPGTAHATLEIGCGSGFLLNKIKEKSNIAVGIDINYDYFDKKYMAQGINFINAKAEKLPFKTSTFDAVVISDVLEHLFDQQRAIDEVDRVLKKDGVFLITVPNKAALDFLDVQNFRNKFPKPYTCFNKIFKTQSERETRQENPSHRHYSARDLKKLLPKNFRVEKREYHGFFLCYIIDILCALYKKIIRKTPDFLYKIGKYDYSINYGPMSYALVLKLRKT